MMMKLVMIMMMKLMMMKLVMMVMVMMMMMMMMMMVMKMMMIMMKVMVMTKINRAIKCTIKTTWVIILQHSIGVQIVFITYLLTYTTKPAWNIINANLNLVFTQCYSALMKKECTIGFL